MPRAEIRSAAAAETTTQGLSRPRMPRARRLAQGKRPDPLPADRAAPAPARRRRLARDPGGDGVSATPL